MATEQGASQAREVGELMSSTADVLDESIRATEQQKEAAEQVSAAMVEIRTAAEQLAAEQQERTGTASAGRGRWSGARACSRDTGWRWTATASDTVDRPAHGRDANER